jgi:GMP reductase
MLGGLLAGHDECEGEWTLKDGKRAEMTFYGMSSRRALEAYAGGRRNYRACEGREIKIPYKGPVKETIQEITGGLRSACAYVGATRLKDLSKCTTFVICNRPHRQHGD